MRLRGSNKKMLKIDINLLTKEDSFIIIPFALLRILLILVIAGFLFKWELSNKIIEYTSAPLYIYATSLSISEQWIKIFVATTIGSIVAFLLLPFIIERLLVELIGLIIIKLPFNFEIETLHKFSEYKEFLLSKYKWFPREIWQGEISQAKRLYEIIKNVARVVMILLLVHSNWVWAVILIVPYYLTISQCNEYENTFDDVFKSLVGDKN